MNVIGWKLRMPLMAFASHVTNLKRKLWSCLQKQHSKDQLQINSYNKYVWHNSLIKNFNMSLLICNSHNKAQLQINNDMLKNCASLLD